MIDAALLKGQIAALERRKQQAMEAFHQCEGALQLARGMLAKIEEEAATAQAGAASKMADETN